MLPMAPAVLRAAPLKVAALFAGRVDDGGFMQAGFMGLERAREKLGAETSFTQGIAPEKDKLAEALRELARQKPDLVIAHGGQNNAAAQLVAAEFPEIRFVVTQGGVIGPNLASYEVLQEQSAFLAGALAGFATSSGVVAHMSGIRVVPGLKGRAAFANGLRHANEKAKLLTNFSGDQDDPQLARKIAATMIDQGADVIFTMLNRGRQGVIDICRERKVAQIGNVRDWVAVAPDIFIASAIADSSLCVSQAVKDVQDGSFKPGTVRQIGIEDPEAVRLSLSDRVSVETRARVAALASEMASGRLVVSTEWSGPEMPNPT